MPVAAAQGRWKAELSHWGNVALRIDGASSVGETPDGVRMVFHLRGTLTGPRLRGVFGQGTLAFLRVDHDGVGTIDVRAPLVLSDGAQAELVATGLYDFGEDGFSRAKQGAEHLPASDLGWCPRLLSADPRYAWLNRSQLLGVGRLEPREARVDYDLYVVAPNGRGEVTAGEGIASLYQRLGGRASIQSLMSESIDSLHGHPQLNAQNPRLVAAKFTTDPARLLQMVTDYICQEAGGPCTYRGKTLAAAHAPLGITEADWDLFMADTARILRERGLAERESNDLLALMNSTKSDIVSMSVPLRDT